MSTQIAAPDEDFGVSPESLEIAKTYLACGDSKTTAEALGIPVEKVSYYLRKPEVKRFIDTIFFEQGYMNRGKLQEIMDKLLDIKVEEMQDSEIGTNKDILDIIQLQHKMRIEELKLEQSSSGSGTNIKQQINVQNPSFGTNYDNLLGKLAEEQ